MTDLTTQHIRIPSITEDERWVNTRETFVDVVDDADEPIPAIATSILDTTNTIGNWREITTTIQENNNSLSTLLTSSSSSSSSNLFKMSGSAAGKKGKNPKLMIIDHLDAQIRRVDIYTEEMLERVEAINNSNNNNNNNNSFNSSMSFLSNRESFLRIHRRAHRRHVTRELTKELLEKGRTETIDELQRQMKLMLADYETERTSDSPASSNEPFLERRFVFVLIAYFLEHEARYPILVINTDFSLTDIEIALLESFINSSKPSRFSPKVGYELDVLDDRLILITELCKAIEKKLSQMDNNENVIKLTKKEVLGIKFFNLQLVKVKQLGEIHLPTLRCFALCHQPIEKIAPNAFEGLPELESLFMFSNSMRLGEEHGRLFRPLTACSKINLSFNQIEHLDLHAFETAFNLRELNLSSNRLKFTKENEAIFDGLVNLQTLNIGYNFMEHVSKRMFLKLSNLRQLVLRGCGVIDVEEDAFSTLADLKTLDLTSNQLRKLPDRLLQGLTRLEDINLLNNELDDQHEQFFDGLVNLRCMWLSSNKLTKATANMFKSLVALQDLYIGNNHMETLELNTFDSLINLQKLDISYNPTLKSFTKPGMFITLVNLKMLNLENIDISSIPDWLFDGLVHLEVLMLGKNQLSKLTRASVLGLSGLKKLNLEANLFVEFDLDILEYLKRIESIVLTRNPIAQPLVYRNHKVRDRSIFVVDNVY